MTEVLDISADEDQDEGQAYRASYVELPVTRRMKRQHHLIEIAEAVMMMMIQ